jgi:hypothetical protein
MVSRDWWSFIHLTLKYEVLDRVTKNQIWTQFLNRSPTAHGRTKISPKDLDSMVNRIAARYDAISLRDLAHAISGSGLYASSTARFLSPVMTSLAARATSKSAFVYGLSASISRMSAFGGH